MKYRRFFKRHSTHLQPGRRWCGDDVCSVLVSCSSIPLKPTQQQPTNPTWDRQYKQQPWKVPNGPRSCAPNTLVEINGSPKSLPLKERIV